MDKSKKSVSKKIVIAITGEICSGKDTLAAYASEELREFGLRTAIIRSSDVLREIFLLLNIEPSRLDFHHLTLYLREKFSEDILSRVVEDKIRKMDSEIVFWAGLRSTFDVDVLGKFTNKSLVFLDVKAKERYQRLRNRDENNGDRIKTWNEFTIDGTRSTEKMIRSFEELSDIVISNNDYDLENAKKVFLDFVKGKRSSILKRNN